MVAPISLDSGPKGIRRLSSDSRTFALATIYNLLVIVAFTMGLAYLSPYKLSSLGTVYPAWLIISFYFIGAGLKFVDDAYDRNRFSKKAAHFVLVGGTLLGLTLTWLDIWAASIFLALLIALALTGKVNRRLFFVPPLIFLPLLAVMGNLSQLHWAFLVVVATAVLADELGAEFAKRHLQPSHSSEVSSQGRKKAETVILNILRNRFIALSVLLGLTIVQWLPFLYWFAWLALDFGYTVVEAISSRLSLRGLCFYVYTLCYVYALLRAFWGLTVSFIFTLLKMKLLILISLSIVAEVWVAVPYGIAAGIDPIIVLAFAIAFNFAPVPLVVELSEEFERRHGYLFRWDCLPGGDSEQVLTFLRTELKLGFSVDAEIKRSADGKMITIREGAHSVAFTLDTEENKVEMALRDGPTHEYISEVHNGSLNVYRRRILDRFAKRGERLIAKYGFVGVVIGVVFLGAYTSAFAAYLLRIGRKKIFIGLLVGLVIEGFGYALATSGIISLIRLIGLIR